MSDTIEASAAVTTARWIATVYYRTSAGLVDVTHDMTELEELQTLVERGPHWDTIDRIEIVRADGCDRALTIEEAATL
jgi:hypothetical protein